MGWIRRNRFWFEHHDLYIEPTEEQKERDRIGSIRARNSLRNIMIATAMLQSSLYQNNPRRY